MPGECVIKAFKSILVLFVLFTCGIFLITCINTRELPNIIKNLTEEIGYIFCPGGVNATRRAWNSSNWKTGWNNFTMIRTIPALTVASNGFFKVLVVPTSQMWAERPSVTSLLNNEHTPFIDQRAAISRGTASSLVESTNSGRLI